MVIKTDRFIPDVDVKEPKLVLKIGIPKEKIIEEVLSQGLEHFQVLFETNPHPMLIIDPKSLAILAVNNVALQLYGYSREELLRFTIKDIRPPEDVPLLMQCLKRYAPQLQQKGYRSVGVYRHRKKDGTIFPVEITASPMQFKGQTARLVLIREIPLD